MAARGARTLESDGVLQLSGIRVDPAATRDGQGAPSAAPFSGAISRYGRLFASANRIQTPLILTLTIGFEKGDFFAVRLYILQMGLVL